MGKEAKLQKECVIWYRNIWRWNNDGFWSTNNEGRDVNTKLSMGMRAGVSDLCLKDERGFGGIEIKAHGESHDVKHVIRQAQWIINVCDFGGFCDSLEQFQSVVQGTGECYDPKRVLAYLNTLKTKSFTWDATKFL